MFRAYEPERDRLVAIKLFRLDLPPERVHQLVAEFGRLIAADLAHPVIAAPLAAGIEGVTAYLAQEYVSAESLDVVIREGGPAPVADALGVAARLAEALDYAADREIVHGALHPRDVLLSPDDFRLVGLGITRALERVSVAAPVRRPYTAPERVGGGAWDRRADVFSLAAVVHELVWGRRIAGTGSQAASDITDAAGGDVPALREVFARALADDMADRFATASAFAEALTGAFDSRSSKVSRLVRRAAPRDAEPMLPLGGDAPDLALRQRPEPLQFRERDAVEISKAEPPGAVEMVSAEPSSADGPAGPAEPREPAGLSAPVGLSAPPALSGSAGQREGGPQGRGEPPGLGSPAAIPARRERVPDPFVPGSLLSSAPAEEPRGSSSLMWPLALAAVVGAALGFGAGYAVAIRDRPGAAATAGAVRSGEPRRETSPGAVEPAAPAAAAAPSPTPGAQAASAPAPKAPVAPLFAGRVLVRSTPPGARVFVDGSSGGETPATVRELARGPHQVRLVHEGYMTVERRIVITAAQPSLTLTVAMVGTPPAAPEKTEAPLVIQSRPPGAKVVLDGRQVGTTPLTFPLVQVGAHSLRLTLEGYRPWAGSIQVSASEPNRVTASLEQ